MTGSEIQLEQSTYVVKAASFEGPLEHLLNLVESRKLFINEVSLAQVTNDYLEYVRALPKYNLGDITGFVVVAATLILIKSRSLLPNLELTQEETENIVDLETRLKLYQKAKDLGDTIRQMYGTVKIHLGIRRMPSEPIFSPDKNVTTTHLHELACGIIDRIPKEVAPHQEVRIEKVMSIEEMIESLVERISSHISMTFSEFTKQHSSSNARVERVHTIVSFLALLELVREGIIDVLQQDTFADMTINKVTTIELTQ